MLDKLVSYPRVVLELGMGDGRLLESEDGGDSWRELGERIGGITALAVK